MDFAKIQLSAEELLLVQNGQWILTKNIIIRKVYQLFGSLATAMKSKIDETHLPGEIIRTTAKISKGENYQELPWVMLDYPRLFTKENVFAIRTFFWWANYFSVTLHLKGEYKNMFAEAVNKNMTMLVENNFHISITGDEWIHDIDPANYTLLTEKIDAEHREHL